MENETEKLQWETPKLQSIGTEETEKDVAHVEISSTDAPS